MSINNLQILSQNPHFIAMLIHSFLTGYGGTCKIQKVFLATPLLMHGDTRQKLEHANSRSKISSIFQSKIEIGESKISGKSCFARFEDRYNYYKDACKKALIILSSDDCILIKNSRVDIINKLNYRNYSGNVKDWLKAAFYLGSIFSQTSDSQISYYLGVDLK